MISIWVVCKNTEHKQNKCNIEFQGAFLFKRMAIGACLDENHFIMPLTIGKELPQESLPTGNGEYYPVFTHDGWRIVIDSIEVIIYGDCEIEIICHDHILSKPYSMIFDFENKQETKEWMDYIQKLINQPGRK